MPVGIKALEIFSKSELYHEWSKIEINRMIRTESKMGELIRLPIIPLKIRIIGECSLLLEVLFAGIDNEIHQDEIERLGMFCINMFWMLIS